MILYAYVEKLFEEQKDIIDSYVSALAEEAEDAAANFVNDGSATLE